MDYSLPGSSIHGIFQAKYWSGLPFPSPEDLPDPGIEPGSPAVAGRCFTIWASREALLKPLWLKIMLHRQYHGKHILSCGMPMCMLRGFSHVRLFVTLDWSLVGFSVHGILQTRILEWVAMPSSRGSSQLWDRTRMSCIFWLKADSLPLSHQGSPSSYRIEKEIKF